MYVIYPRMLVSYGGLRYAPTRVAALLSVGAYAQLMYLDWEGVSASVTVASPYTWLTVDIVDSCGGGRVGGGSRWAVNITTANSGVVDGSHHPA